jgi:hypothetical protein
MLSLAVLGMAAYGLYSAGLGAVDLFGVYGLDWWADLGLLGLGALLMLSSAFVRVLMPGGLALAASALLALQALSFHNDVHFYGSVMVLPQVVRGIVAGGLLVLAFEGARRTRRQVQEEASRIDSRVQAE